MPQRSIVVLADVGGPGFHVGDEAMLAANLELLRRAAPSVAVTVLARAAGAADIAAAVAGADGVLVSGGGNMSASWPALLEQRIALLDAAARATVPAVVTGQTIGPALEPGQRARLGPALGGAVLVGARERPSVAQALGLGVGVGSLVLQVDDAFGMSATAPDDPELLAVAESGYLAVTLDGSYGSAAARPASGPWPPSSPCCPPSSASPWSSSRTWASSEGTRVTTRRSGASCAASCGSPEPAACSRPSSRSSRPCGSPATRP